MYTNGYSCNLNNCKKTGNSINVKIAPLLGDIFVFINNVSKEF